MADITAAMVKELRELTGAGMLDCKNALTDVGGDIKKAIDNLREKGLAAAAKKAGRIASEGVAHVLVSADEKTGVVVEVNSETDFVAKNAEFRTFVDDVTNQLIVSKSGTLEAFMAEKWSAEPQYTVTEALSQKIAVIGENLNIRRFDKIEATDGSFFATYIHGGGKMAVLLLVESTVVNDDVRAAAKNICMQIAALTPKYVSRNEIDADFLDKEREILKTQALNENTGKPVNVIEKMVEGRLNKNLKEICLLDQQYVKDQDITVAQYVAQVAKENGAEISLKSFVCYERGEGIEKKEENFADEVNKAING